MTSRPPSRPANRRVGAYVRPTIARCLRRRGVVSDEGMTLTELLIASTLMIVLLTAVVITMDMINTVNARVTAQYQEFDQGLLAVAPLQTLIRAEIEPGPAQTASPFAPQPGFASVSNFSLTFYSNIGTAYNNVTSDGTTGGPAKIVARELDANGNPVTSATTCSTAAAQLCTFQIQEYLPVINGGVSTCPVGSQPATNVCQYTNPPKLLADVLGVVNNPATLNTDPTQAIFTYNVFDASSGNSYTLTSTQVLTPPTCTGPSAAACPSDSIQSVGVHLVVGKKAAGANGNLEYQTIIYRYPGSAGASSYPYQYTSAAG